MGAQKSGYINFVSGIRRTLLFCILLSIFFVQIAIASNPQIKLTTNRYIILDDPNQGYSGVTANADTGFGKPWSWNTDAWRNESTTIRGVALVLNVNGAPASGVTVTFSVQDWNDPSPRTLKSDTNNKTNVTNAYGLATASFNLNNEQQYGRWKVTATATVNGTPVSSSSNFIYNWWGCQNCHGSPYSNQGRGSKDYPNRISPSSTRYDPYSPYVTGRDFHNEMYTNHHLPTGGELVEGECWACHNSYDKDLNLGQEYQDNGASYAGKGIPSTYGVHANKTCADCHSIIGTSRTGSQIVKSCDATGCHQGSTDFNSYVGPETVVATSPNKYVNYSGQDVTAGLRTYSGIYPTAATFNSNPLTGARAHTSATVQNIPCTLCHGPMHNITKPDINTVPKNTVTEDTQCTTCHQPLKHSTGNPVYCTACHSQDAHTINILNKSAVSQPSYVFIGSANAITSSTSDCEQCHAPGTEANFFASLKTYDSAAYSKNFTPATPVHNRHNGTVSCNVCHDNSNFHNITYLTASGTYSTSNVSAVTCIDCHSGQNPAVRDTVNSKLGRLPPVVNTPVNHSTDSAGAHWGTYWSDANGACLYCHGDNKHNATRLGNALAAVGSDNIGGAIGTGTVCSSCHNPGDSNYAATMSVLNPDPVANQPGSVNWNASGVDHSSYGATDADCKACHGGVLSVSAGISEFLHNVDTGKSGGPNCIGCHNVGGIAGPGRLVNVSAMNEVNSLHKNLNRDAVTGLSPENKKCWACHGNGNEPGQGHPANYQTPYRCTDCHIPGAGQNTNFTPGSILEISQHYWNGTSIKTSAATSCYDCHNKSEMMLGQNLDPDDSASVYGGANGGSNSTSHYGRKRSDYPVQGTNDYCYQCHNNPATAFPFVDDANKIIVNHSTNYASSPNCSDCHATQAGRIHNSTLYKPALSLPNSTFCLNCHGAGGSATIRNKEQHNGTLDCTQCHLNSTRSIHPVQYLQQDGISWNIAKANAVNCTNCHQGAGISGFDVAPKVPEPVNHSTSLSAGQKWGNYWDNTSQITACYYCHQNEIHENNTDLLGSISIIKGSNTLNNPDLANSTWCANCHYAGAQDYKGNLLAVSPPEITDSSLAASDGTLFFNHSSLSGFNDSNCKSCHGRALSGYLETSLNLSHSVSEGGGDNCIDCHGTNYIGASPSVTRTFVNISAFNESIHQEINATPVAIISNQDCWTCHYNKDMNRQNVKKCGDCHRKPSQWHGNADITTNLSELW